MGGIVKLNKVPPPGKTAKGASAGTVTTTVTAAGVKLSSATLNLDGRTAGTGGIMKISGERRPDGSTSIEIGGVLKPSTPRRGFEKDLSSAGELADPRVKGYERAHLWGPGFGDEARDGMMLAPREVNQVFQNEKMENALRELQKEARAQYGNDATVILNATASSHPPSNPALSEPVLAEVKYEFAIARKGEEPIYLATVVISVDPPPVTNPKTGIQIGLDPPSPSDDAAVLLDALPEFKRRW